MIAQVLEKYRQPLVEQRNSNKLEHKYFEPFWVAAKIGKVAYKVDLPKTAKIYDVFHVSLFKPYI